MPPRVRLARTHGRSNTPRHEIQAVADLSPGATPLNKGAGNSPRSMNSARGSYLRGRGWRDGVVPFAVEGVSGHVEGFDLLFGDFDAFFVDGRMELGHPEFSMDFAPGKRACPSAGRLVPFGEEARAASMVRPVLVVVARIYCVASLKERKGLALQLAEIGANILCSMGFHLLVPGG